MVNKIQWFLLTIGFIGAFGFLFFHMSPWITALMIFPLILYDEYLIWKMENEKS